MEYSIERAGSGDREAILKVMEPWNMHRVPSPEMEELDLSCFFVARGENGMVIGAGGYKILSETTGKTTLLGVYPAFQGLDIGKKLQDARLEALYEAGVKSVITNSDRSEIILWYKKHYGYREIGTLRKVSSFGLDTVDHWTTLEMDLDAFFKNKKHHAERVAAYIADNDPAPLSPYPPLLINVCLTGMVPTRLSSPFVPLSVDEIVEDAVKVYDAGARIVHLHARDEEGRPTSDAVYYEKIISAIRRERPGLICCATTSGRDGSDVERRSEVLHLTGTAKPDMASLTLGSLNFISGASVNSITTVEQLAMKMKENGIKPELEVFDYGMVNLAKYLERHGLIGGKKYFNILLGNMNTAPATIGNLAGLTDALPDESVWAAAGLGSFQLPMNVAAVAAGGHIRVGLEDSVYYDFAKTRHATNEALVQRVVRIADEMQRRVATAEEAREMLGL
jgi:3-keto-5-aminohexanoate cleavage enzyme